MWDECAAGGAYASRRLASRCVKGLGGRGVDTPRRERLSVKIDGAEWARELDHVGAVMLAHAGAMGLAVAVADATGVVVRGHWGLVEEDTPVQLTETTRVYVAVAVMQCWERGLLNLFAPLSV